MILTVMIGRIEENLISLPTIDAKRGARRQRRTERKRVRVQHRSS
jgi:hypothetical protein